jgi:SEC-C motif-containing protein
MSAKPKHKPTEREESLCPCKSQETYGACCMPYHYLKAKPETAEQLMRSRFSAYFFRRVEYLIDTTHPDTRDADLKQEIFKTMEQVSWSFLKILSTSGGGKEDKTGKVEFVADYYLEGELHELHERARFRRFKGAWKYLDGKR